ncbi:hypothetical protein NDU88_007301 [Pleurodeles waltl]|uniref:Uncharacterized protein n=1 Tax=Pleurodeles waltl TaxID=8319 RepID=A0AAV7VT72_PLEWA|nr:hypothetical protein NDU88_007301 [Pleurodeles waltl]
MRERGSYLLPGDPNPEEESDPGSAMRSSLAAGVFTGGGVGTVEAVQKRAGEPVSFVECEGDIRGCKPMEETDGCGPESPRGVVAGGGQEPR